MDTKMQSFGQLFDNAYSSVKGIRESIAKSMDTRAAQASLSMEIGHPIYDRIKYGEIVPGNIVVFFMDIRGFTKLSIALDNTELINILQATTLASIYSIRQFNGYIADFTGDGIMAYFGGDPTTDEDDAYRALQASAFMMQGIKENVNKHLDNSIEETIRVGMGVEYGNVLWTRIGLPNANQVKPISEVTFIAGKNSSQSQAWEVVLGKNIATWLPDNLKEKYDSYSFIKDKTSYQYERFSFKWNEFIKSSQPVTSNLETLLKSKRLPAIPAISISSDGTIAKTVSSKDSGPRPLKDQPFFGE